MDRLKTKDIYKIFLELIQNRDTWKYDKATNQHFVEIQDCHFIADSKYIVEHNKIIYSTQWYRDHYDPALDYMQLLNNLNFLKDDQYSRKAFIYMGNKYDNSICTTGIQMILDNNKLNWIVNMRSNNAIIYSTDYDWHNGWYDHAIFMLSEMRGQKIEKGTIYWNACSMHVYEEDFELFL